MKYTSTRNASKHYTFEEALFSGYAPDGGLFVPVELPNLLGSSSSSSSSSSKPSINKNQILSDIWPKLGYTDLATEILHPFIGDGEGGISKTDLRSLLERALTGFDVPDTNLVPIVPMIRRGNENDVDCYVAELFHGPTFCFKDLGMRATVFLLEYFASNKHKNSGHPRDDASTVSPPPSNQQKKVVLTAATTGDTGPAAVQAVLDLDSPYLGIVVHYPEGQISDFQRKQMTTVVSDRVEVVSFEGGGDDMDRPIKDLMRISKQNSSTNNNNDDDDDGCNLDNILVCGVNSYNIGRPLMQMIHFVWTYLRVVEDIERRTNQKIDHDRFRLDVVIPTGAMGNIAGCYMAKKLGVSFGKLCAGVNDNDITHRAFSTGIVRKPRSDEPMKPSLSDAINIQLPYNLERLLFYLTNQDHSKVKAWYERLEEKYPNPDDEGRLAVIDLTSTVAATLSSPPSNGKLDPKSWLEELQTEFRSARVNDTDLCDTMKRVLETYEYWIDPHTGVAFGAAEQLGYMSFPKDTTSTTTSTTTTSTRNYHDECSAVAIMATASPCKFQKAVTQALGKYQWNEYQLHHFPSRGKDLMDYLEERPPIRYEKISDKQLQNTVWRENTKQLIAKLGRR